jgi:hypothetical protein
MIEPLSALYLGLSVVVFVTACLCAWEAATKGRPDPRNVAPLSVAAWWVGQAVAWLLLLLVAGGILGLAARAAWRLTGP